MYYPPKNDPEYSLMRLNRIMGRRRLSFNPYTVSDRRLIEIAETAGWGNLFDITEIVILQFTRLRERSDYRKFDGIFMRVGRDEEEIFIPAGALSRGVTANDTIRRERSWIGKKPLKDNDDVAALVGKRVFVSRVIRGENQFGSGKSAYKMYRLWGKESRDAGIIRQAMCDAKIEMLERVLAYPESPDYLSCKRGLINYEPRIHRAIEIIRHYPQTPVPKE